MGIKDMLGSLISAYQEARYYEALNNAQGAYQEILDDPDYAYHYKLLQTDSHGRVTSYISGNGLINSNTYDDSGAMVRTRKSLAQSYICKAHCGYYLLLEVPFANQMRETIPTLTQPIQTD